MKQKSIFIVLFLLLLLTHSINADNIDIFAWTLKNISMQKANTPIKKEEFRSDANLLGPWLVDQDIKGKTLKDYRTKLIAYDKDKNIYQINVLRQWKGDCWVHSFRNILYFMDLVTSPRKDFDTIYKNMIDHKQYKAFTKNGCPRIGHATHEFIQEQLKCKPNCIPENSLTYVKKIIRLYYTPAFSDSLKTTTKKDLTNIEKQTISDQAAQDYLALSDQHNFQYENINKLVTLFHELREKQSDFFGLNISIGLINHDVNLLVHKSNGVIEYVFADSNNVSFTGNNKTTITEKGETIYYSMSDHEYDLWKKTFSAALHQIISFVQYPESFDDTIVRMLYKKLMSNDFQYENAITSYISMFYDSIKNYKLLNNKLYKSTYRQLYENRIVQLLYDDMLNYYNLQKEHNIKISGFENWKHLAQFGKKLLEPFYTNLKKYGLENNTIYTTLYKKKYCDFINQEQSVHKDKQYHKELLKKISC